MAPRRIPQIPLQFPPACCVIHTELGVTENYFPAPQDVFFNVSENDVGTFFYVFSLVSEAGFWDG